MDVLSGLTTVLYTFSLASICLSHSEHYVATLLPTLFQLSQRTTQWTTFKMYSHYFYIPVIILTIFAAKLKTFISQVKAGIVTKLPNSGQYTRYKEIVSIYIIVCWTTQSALHLSSPGRPVHSDTNSSSPRSIPARQQLRAKTKSLTFPPLSIA